MAVTVHPPSRRAGSCPAGGGDEPAGRSQSDNNSRKRGVEDAAPYTAERKARPAARACAFPTDRLDSFLSDEAIYLIYQRKGTSSRRAGSCPAGRRGRACRSLAERQQFAETGRRGRRPLHGGAEGSSRCAGMSLPYGSAELLRFVCRFRFRPLNGCIQNRPARRRRTPQCWRRQS